MTVRDVLEEAVRDLAEVETARTGDRLEWRRGDQVFAILDGDAAEFRLDQAVTRAALRTPDTEPSSRGPEWVRFSPSVLDSHAIDRAEAWLAAAWRRARE